MTEPTNPDAPVGGVEFTPEQLAAAREQLIAQGELAAPAAPAHLGQTVLESGAMPDQIDAIALLHQIQAMQAQLDQMAAEKKAELAPDVVKYAEAAMDHLTAKAVAHPMIGADPDWNYGTGLETLAGLKEAAAEAADAAAPGRVADAAAKAEAWVRQHAAHFPHIDYGYILQLITEAGVAAAKLGV